MRILSILIIMVLVVGCDNSDQHTKNTVSKIAEISNQKYQQLKGMHRFLGSEIKNLYDQIESDELLKYHSNVDSLMILMDLTIEKIDQSVIRDDLQEIKNDWLNKRNGLSISDLKINWTKDMFKEDIGREFLKYDIIYGTYDALAVYAADIEKFYPSSEPQQK